MLCTLLTYYRSYKMTLTTAELTFFGRTFTQNTNKLRKAVALTKEELAYHAGLSKSTIARIESARKARRTYSPALSTVVKLANLANVGVDDFIRTNLKFQ